MKDTTSSPDNPLRFRKNLLKMTASEKIKTNDNKIEQIKAQYDLESQAAKISALSSGNIGKYEFLTGEEGLSEKGLLEKSAEKASEL